MDEYQYEIRLVLPGNGHGDTDAADIEAVVGALRSLLTTVQSERTWIAWETLWLDVRRAVDLGGQMVVVARVAAS